MKCAAKTVLTKSFCILIICAITSFAFASAYIPPMARVVDLTQTLNKHQITNLNQMLQKMETENGAQIGILIVDTTQPETIEQYSLRVEEEWKLGHKNIDDGVLLVVALKDRKMRVEVGYGLEGVLSDVISKRIISDVITPYFVKGQIYDGVYHGVMKIINTIQSEPLASHNNDSNSYLQIIPFLLLILLYLSLVSFVIILILSFFYVVIKRSQANDDYHYSWDNTNWGKNYNDRDTCWGSGGGGSSGGGSAGGGGSGGGGSSGGGGASGGW